MLFPQVPFSRWDFGIFSSQCLQKDSSKAGLSHTIPVASGSLGTGGRRSPFSQRVTQPSVRIGGRACHGFAEPAPRGPGPGELEGAEHVLPSGTVLFFDEVWVYPSWGYLRRFKKTKGPCFWTIASQILCTVESDICRLSRKTAHGARVA